MTFIACLTKLEEDGVIDRKRAERYRALYDQMEGDFVKKYGAGPGAVLAGDSALRALEWDAQLSRRQAALQVVAQRQALADMDRFDKGSGKKDTQAVIAMMGRDIRAPYMSVESRAEMLNFQSHRQIGDFIDHHGRNLVGRIKNQDDLKDVIRARHGDKIDNPQAQVFSDAIGQVFESQRQRFNLLGGDIGYDAKYGLTHSWDSRRTRMAGYDKWRSVVLPELDLNRMKDPLTGEAFTSERLEEALRAVYETIRTDGLSGLGSANVGGAKKLANRRSDPRFLQFKDGDAWMRVNEQFGTADPYTAIINQIHGMNRDIALLERFGPNPDATVKFLSDQAARRNAQSDDPSPDALNKADAAPRKIDKMWRILNGDAGVPILDGKLGSMATVALHTGREIETAAKLGSSVLSAIGDLATMDAVKKFNGLGKMDGPLGHLSNASPFSLETTFGYIRGLNPASNAERELARDLELGMRDSTTALLGMARYFGETQTSGAVKVLADASLRLGLINKFTEVGQDHFGLTFLNWLARERGKGFDGLEPELRRALTNYGIGAADWDVMRAAPVYEHPDGRKFMSGPMMREVNAGVADRMMDMVLSETQAAVVSVPLRVRAMMEVGNPGTLMGEVSRTGLQFKSFTASYMLLHGERMLGSGSKTVCPSTR